jgi:glycosyltransferase involved in cell wall biosynthesis
MPKPEKVYIVGPTESILTQRGNRHPSLATFLVKQGYALEYVTSDFYHAEKRWFSREEIRLGQEKVPYKLTVKRCIGYKANISIRRIIANILLTWSFFFYLLPRLNRRTVLILPSRPVEMMFAAALLRLIRGTSVALDIQDIWPDMLVVDSRLKRTLFRYYCNLYLYPSLRFIDKFFHVAPSFENWLDRYARKATSTFIPLGFDAERWRDAAPIEKNTDQSLTIQLACVSQLTFQFNIMPLLKALNLRRAYHLKSIGEDGTGQRYREVVEFIEKQKMDNATIVGLVSRQEMVRELRGVDIGIVPMVSTSIPNKVFDYIASYIPLLVLGKNDSAEFVEQLGIGWSVEFNERAIGEFLDSITREEIRRKAARVAEIRHRFSRDVLHEQILEVIEK